MKRQTKILVPVLTAGIVIAFLPVWFAANLTQEDFQRKSALIPKTEFSRPPVFVGMKKLSPPLVSRQPFALATANGKLIVSYLNSDRIDEFSDRLERLRTLRPLGRRKASITGLAVAGNRLFAVDSLSGGLMILDYKTGKILRTFGQLPDRKTRTNLFGVSYAGGNIYLTDSRANRVLVVSVEAVPNVKNEGQLILTFPDSSSGGEFQLSGPTFNAATPDGRLLVSDRGNSQVKAFACSGIPAHLMETNGDAAFAQPMGIAFDDLSSPKLMAMADSTNHPSAISGIFRMGRIHVVDSKQGKVKVFDSMGRYMFTYGKELRRPNGIAIDSEKRLIFVSDQQLQAIAVYKY